MNPSLTDYVATILLIRPLMQSLLIFVLPERKLVSLETSLRKQSSYMGTYFYLYFFLETAWLFSQAKSWWCIWPFFWFTNWDKLKLTITDIVKSWSLCGIHPSFFFQLASCHRLRGGVYLRQVASLFQCCGFAVLKKIKLTLSFLHDPTSSPETPKGFSSALCFISLYVQKHNNLLRCDYNFFFICSLCLSQHTEPALFPRTHLSYLSISL